jgi:hypothetical protein
MKSDRDLFDSAEAEARAEARAEQDISDRRVISHNAVRRWLKSWGSEKRLPSPRAGD